MMSVSSPADTAGRTSRPFPSTLNGLGGRRLDRYPESGPRYWYLAIVVLATIVLYYQLYIQYAVSTAIISHYHMTFLYFVYISVAANAVGAFSSLVAGLADRWGRANIVVYGLLLVGLLTTFVLPNAPGKASYLVVYSLVSLVEGMILVATPALIRDFSPQLGRASAMGYWTMGPIIGSLVVTAVTSRTFSGATTWQDEIRYAGISGLVVFVVALFGLRELAPALRDQIMVSLRDRALVEARAKGMDTEAALRGQWRQMLRLDVIGSAVAISVYLLLYFAAVGNFVLYFATTFGYTPQRANALLNWYSAAITGMQRAARHAVRATSGYDAVLTPTLATLPQPLEFFDESGDPLDNLRRQSAFSAFTSPYNMTGQPAVNVPLYWTPQGGIPVGVSLVGRPADEATLIALSAQLEEAHPWHDRYARLFA
ncbi:MFS transporter [Streptomyces sp. NPDC058320]|uniref:MFS transporter n=1 Tax=unclassified Streptomyces TaxID=2593676 RepID=UPI0036380721